MNYQEYLVNVNSPPPEALTVKKCPRTAVCTLCKYVDDKKPKINGSLEFSPDEYHTFSA